MAQDSNSQPMTSASPAPTSGAPTTSRRKGLGIPRGVIILGLLLYAGAFILTVTSLVLPAVALQGVPRWIPVLGAVVVATIATGLFRRRRWAWFSMLSFIGVSAFYLLRGTAERGQNTIIGLTILAIIAGYLLWPKVREVYLR